MTATRTREQIRKLVKQRSKIKLDVGGGENGQTGFVVMDRRKVKGVDVVHDIEDTPWPFPADCASVVMMSHVWEHVEPKKTIDVANEIWRVLEEGGQWWIIVPYGWSYGYLQDPTHQNPSVEATWEYFCPKFPLWQIYKPKPWHMSRRDWQVFGNMEVILTKIKEGQ